MASVQEHFNKLRTVPRYAELIAAVEAKAKELDAAYDALLAEFPLTEPGTIYCVFGDGSCRPTYTRPPEE